MKRFVVLSLLAMMVAGAAAAGPLEFGLRAAYAVPLKGDYLNQIVSAAVPFRVDLGWQFNTSWTAGTYLAYGPTFVPDEVKYTAEEPGFKNVRGHFLQQLGAEVLYRFRSNEPSTPWLGLAAGYEWNAYVHGETPWGAFQVEYSGWEGSIQGGLDFRPGEHMNLGPYALLSVGRYSDYTFELGSVHDQAKLDNQALHEWIQFGIRATFH